jgi:hypothetical protein
MVEDITDTDRQKCKISFTFRQPQIPYIGEAAEGISLQMVKQGAKNQNEIISEKQKF